MHCFHNFGKRKTEAYQVSFFVKTVILKIGSIPKEKSYGGYNLLFGISAFLSGSFGLFGNVTVIIWIVHGFLELSDSRTDILRDFRNFIRSEQHKNDKKYHQ